MKSKILNRKFEESKVKKSYSKVAWFYDFWSLLTESKAANKVLKIAAIENGESILEVAVGTGQMFKEILKQNPDGENKGIEISPSMLSRANKRLSKVKNINYTILAGSAYQLPFKDNSFDLIINNFMMDLLPENDFNKILSEFYRVTKTSGRVVISTMAFGHKWYNNFWHWIAKKFPALLTGCRPVSITHYLEETGFLIEKKLQISQNTFPSEIVSAKK